MAYADGAPASYPQHGIPVATGPVGKAPFHPTPSLDPRNIEAIEGWEEFKDYLVPAQNAFSAAYEGLILVSKARDVVDKNTAWPDAQKLLNVASAAEKFQDKILKQFDASIKNLAASVSAMESQLSAPLEQQASAGTLNQEIRAHLKGMKAEERSAFISAAIKRGDAKTCTACLGAPGYLSGLNDQSHSIYSRMWHETASPALVRKLKATQRALDLLGERGGLVHTQIEQAIGGKMETVARLRATDDAAKQALILAAG